MSNPRYTFNSERAHIRIQRILDLLNGGPMSTREVGETLHMDQTMASAYLRFLMFAPRRVYICGYRIVGKRSAPLYALGDLPNAKPTRQTNKERWARVKADPVKYAKSLESRRNVHRRKREQIPIELRARDRRVFDPPLCQQIVALLEEVPGYTCSQIAAKMDISLHTVRTSIDKLRRDGKIQRVTHGSGKEYQWEVPHKPLPAPLSKTLGIKPQSWAAALGV